MLEGTAAARREKDQMRQGDSYLLAALLSQYNLVALGAAAVLSVAALSPLPFVAALGLELIYLGTVPNLPGFKRLVRRQRQADRLSGQLEQLGKMLDELSPNQREYYFSLRELRDKILENYRRLPGGGGLAETSSGRVDGLLVSFVRLLATLNNYRRYLNNVDRKALERELAELRVELGGGEAGAEKLKEIKQRRVEILEKRLERFDRAAGSRELISHQLASIEDFMRLLHEQSITLRDPQTVGPQLEGVSAEIQATDETVREMEGFLSFSDELNPLTPPERERTR
jgi:hypothetical protein